MAGRTKSKSKELDCKKDNKRARPRMDPKIKSKRTRNLTSQSVIPVFGSSIAGTRPFGLIFKNSGFLTSVMPLKSVVVYGNPSSSSTMATFHGLGPVP